VADDRAGASPAKSDGPVYGASYPPEMIEAMMQEYNAKHSASAGSGFWGGGRARATSQAASSSTPSVSDTATPTSADKARGAAANGNRDAAGGEAGEAVRRVEHGGCAEAAGQGAEDSLEGAVVGTGQSDGRAEAAATAAAAGRGGAHGVGLRPGKEEPAAPAAHSGKDCRTIAKYDKVLSQQLVDLEELQQLCWSGCPNHLRPVTWRLLLRYAPGNADRREDKMR